MTEGATLARELEIRDAVIDEIAGWVGESSFSEIMGIAAKRKRAREDAQLRGDTIRAYRKELVNMILGRKANRADRFDEDMRDIAAGVFGNARGLGTRDLAAAFRLADQGLAVVSVTATLAGSFNCSTPETVWQVELTERGRALLAELDGAHPA